LLAPVDPAQVPSLPHSLLRSALAAIVISADAASSILAVLVALSGCVHTSRQTITLRPGEPLNLKTIDLRKQTMIIPLQAGETFPFDISVDGEFISTLPGASVPLTVKRDCFLRLDDRGLRISPDDHSFDAKPKKPGTFQIGLGVTAAGKRATMRLVTPTR
jgi:hypothetical protein